MPLAHQCWADSRDIENADVFLLIAMMHCEFRFDTCSRVAGFAVSVACVKGSEMIFEHSVSATSGVCSR
jgi:hypothetical protein